MSNNGKAGSGRGNSRKRSFKRRGNETRYEGDSRGKNPDAASGRAQAPIKANPSKNNAENVRGERTSYLERPKWVPPKMNTEPMPVSDCPWCGKPIRDMVSAIADKDTGRAVHFDCVTARIAFAERLEKGDTVAYIGGGRFAIVTLGAVGATGPNPSRAASSQDFQDETGHTYITGRASTQTGNGFVIKKIIEWENKEKRAEWRSAICDHYSVT